MRLWLLDVASEPGARIDLWLKDETCSTWLCRLSYPQSFYIVGLGDKAVALLEAEGLRFEKCRRSVRGKPVDAFKIYARRDDLEDYAAKLAKRMGDVEVYEADLRSSVKYLLERDVRPCSWIEVDAPEVGVEDSIHVLGEGEVRQAEDAPPPRLRTAAIDVVFFAERGSARPDRDPVRLISLCFDDGAELQLEGEESEILKSLISAIRGKDPDILVGFGVNRLQWGYLVERAKRLGIRLDLGRLGAEPRTSVHGHVSIRGRLNIDLEDMARDIPELTIENLEEFVSYLGIDARLDTIEEYELAERWAEDRESVKRYSMQRAKAILKAFEALRDFIFSLSSLTYMPADYVLTASAGFRVENYLMSLAVK
ncbi:MAG TPA: hypothetical protein ENG52_05055, partial [Nitrososphaeria archaeon]|nr:hypothetical protein [Nitrososphaeria archaeon]